MHFYNWLLFSFKGRINRRTFWLFQLAIFCITLFLLLLLGGDALETFSANPEDREAMEQLMRLGWMINLVLIWPKLAIDVKRFHDRDRAWYWVLIQLIPLVGPLWYLIEAGLMPGTQGDNRFGPMPGATRSSTSGDEGRFDA